MKNEKLNTKIRPIRVRKESAEMIIGACKYWRLNFRYISELISDIKADRNSVYKCCAASRCMSSIDDTFEPYRQEEWEVFCDIKEMVENKIVELIGRQPQFFKEEAPILLAGEGKMDMLMDYIKTIEQSIQII